MAYFAKTTGQGQGLAQVVKQDRVAEDYLEQERKRQEADAKRNSLIRKMDYLGNNLDGKYKEAFKQIYDDILSQVKDGQLSAQDGVGILEMNAKDLKSSQDQFVNYAKSDHSKDISWDKDKVSNPDTYLIDMLFGQDNEEDPFEAIKRANNIMARTESIPETLEEQFTKKYLPLLKQKENVFTQEEVDTKSDEELMKILKSTTRKVPQEILDQIEQGFVNDPEVQRAIVINNGMYKVQEDGVSVEDEANVDAFASDFFNKMTSPRVTIVEQERKDTGKGGGSREKKIEPVEVYDQTIDLNLGEFGDDGEMKSIASKEYKSIPIEQGTSNYNLTQQTPVFFMQDVDNFKVGDKAPKDFNLSAVKVSEIVDIKDSQTVLTPSFSGNDDPNKKVAESILERNSNISGKGAIGTVDGAKVFIPYNENTKGWFKKNFNAETEKLFKEKKEEKVLFYQTPDGTRYTPEEVEGIIGNIPDEWEEVTESNKAEMDANRPSSATKDTTTRQDLNEREAERRGVQKEKIDW